jgi:hypothetical protein
MKILYGIDPDLCISHPELVAGFGKDLVLPKYFYSQLAYLKDGNFQAATEAATKILTSLNRQPASELLVFTSLGGGTVYFHDQELNPEFLETNSETFDIRNPLDRYLLSLFKLAECLESKVFFLPQSAGVIRKCLSLQFEVAITEDFSTPGESWLAPEMLADIPAMLDPLAQVQWLEDTDEFVEPADSIQWIDIIN